MGAARGRARRKLIIAALVIGVLAAPVPFAQATKDFAFTRVAGDDRYATAKALALGFATTADKAVLATGENFPDALAGSYLAGQLNAPLLLTRPDALPEATDEALTALKVKAVTLLGGPAAISPAVEADLKIKGYAVDRIVGSSRYDTARRVAEKPGAAAVGQIDGVPAAFVATGENFPDAVAVGPIAFGGKLPVLLTDKDTLSSEARTALDTLGIKRVVLLGGPVAVSSAVESQLRDAGTEVTRIAGANRSDTAAQLADLAVAKLAFSTATVNLARGDAFADALAGGPTGGKARAATLLTASASDIGAATKQWLSAHQTTLTSGTIFGGIAAVSNAVKGEAEVAGGGQPVAAALTITDGPADKVPVKDTKPTYKGTAEAYQGTVSQVQVEVKGPKTTVLVTVECGDCTGPTAAWAFAPESDLEGGTYTLTFTATNDAGKTSKPLTRTLVVDTTPPQIDGVQATANSKDVTAVFTEPLDCKTVSRDDFKVRFGAGGTASQPLEATCSGDAATSVKLANATEAKHGTTVEVSVIDAINDIAGNEAPHTSKSTTVAQAPPTTTTTSTTTPNPPQPAKQCSDGADNDGDGKTDWSNDPAVTDPDCDSADDDSESGENGGPDPVGQCGQTDDSKPSDLPKVGQVLWDLVLSGIGSPFHDPDHEGPVSGEIWDTGQETFGGNENAIRQLGTNQVACVVGLVDGL